MNKKVNEEGEMASLATTGGMGNVIAPANDGTNVGFNDPTKVGSGDSFGAKPKPETKKKKKKKRIKDWETFKKENN